MINKVTILGRVGKDPEVRVVSGSTSVANFSIATSESYKDRTTGEKKENTEWHNVVLWRSLAEIAAKYVHKGDLIYIEGKIKTRSWEKDGVTRYTTEIIADELRMISTKNNAKPAEQTQSSESTNNAPNTQSNNSTDDLPF